MKPKVPVPQTTPFITFLTCAYRRPQGLAKNMASIANQTCVNEIEHIVLPDHMGHGPNAAVYGRLPFYVEAPRGEYVHVLGDDDALADDKVVERVKAFARKHNNPTTIVVRCQKGGTEFPKCGLNGLPKEGDVDLCNFVVRRDAWKLFVTDYGRDYKCDWDGYLRLKQFAALIPLDLLFAVGKEGTGRPEVDW